MFNFYLFFNAVGLTPLHVSINSHGNKMSRASDEIIDSMSAIFLLAKHGANLNAPVSGHFRSSLSFQT